LNSLPAPRKKTESILLKSMTGFGRASFSINKQTLTIEVRSLNHRFLDIKTRIPDTLSIIETEIRGLVKKRISRGSVVVTILSEDGTSAPSLNMEAARAYSVTARILKAELNLTGEVDLALVLRQKGVFSEKPSAIDEKGLLAGVKSGLGRAIDELDSWRLKEGRTLGRDLKKRIRAIKAALTKVKKGLPRVRKAHKQRIAARIKGLSKNALAEPAVLVETAVFADKTDVTEEIVRLKSHLVAFGEYLAADEEKPIGKKLDFLAQEIFRELNTIASKAQDALICQTIVSMKCELEKIREQVQNIE